jgi:hypothetical protein
LKPPQDGCEFWQKGCQGEWPLSVVSAKAMPQPNSRLSARCEGDGTPVELGPEQTFESAKMPQCSFLEPVTRAARSIFWY